MKKLNLISAAVFFASISSHTLAAGEHILALSHYGSPSDTITKATELMAKRANELSNGRITIKLHPNSELGPSGTQIDGTRMGTIDIVVVGNPYYTTFNEELNLLDLPFLFRDEAHVEKVLAGEIGNNLLKSLEKSGLKGLAFYEIGFRDITNSKKQITTVSDLSGLKLRTTPNPAHIAAFKEWGANPTPMPFNEVYFSLKTGVIDGQENPVHHIYNNNLQEVQKYLSLTHHAYTAAPMAMNLERFNYMDKEDQEILLQAAREGAELEKQLNIEENKIYLEKLKEQGMEVEANPDVNTFQVGAKKAWDDYAKKFGDSIIQQVTDTK
ncbi:TRAP transporter substrate-binding protein [Testudinibacter aquarius]|uniref:TRAP transporter substrate-binding protein n=1 Tax=Testudinibacter aquarius TaxID=1524974 RepID=A0A4R3YDG6_9PAST|nr:TRAP transporter substrate-binding protein [Testudinibacter aquarius]KAE9529372.1 C4-dicarboxylate ABC transporter substrate-binding protein [Testudinibacter aquarius]TCV89882.1 tripartite ATP-independent transporter DctP family solute receptor [Testudinibacter aquarius]TNG93744.1 TRAP transporter substrate-binding protein [Testudinibacter aquarius]